MHLLMLTATIAAIATSQREYVLATSYSAPVTGQPLREACAQLGFSPQDALCEAHVVTNCTSTWLANAPNFCRLPAVAEARDTCEVRRVLIKVENVLVLVGLPGGGDRAWYFTQEGTRVATDPYKDSLGGRAAEQRAWDFIRQSKHVTRVPALLSLLPAYDAFYHVWAEVLPQLRAVGSNRSGLPRGLPLCFTRKLPASLVHNILPPATFLPCPSYSNGRVWAVDALYLPREESRVHPRADWLAVNPGCSWGRGLDRKSLRLQLWPWATYFDDAASPAIRVLVVHRVETAARQVANHEELVAALRRHPQYAVTEFVGRDHSLQDSFGLFRRADVVIGPHGAAFAFAQAMRPGSALLELTMVDQRENSHHTYDFFRLMAQALDVRYGLTVCAGTAGSLLVAPIAEVLATLEKLI